MQQKKPAAAPIENDPVAADDDAVPFDRAAYQREYMRQWRASHKDEPQTAVYRHFDSRGRLLYVGVASDITARTQRHKKAAWWSEVVRTEVFYYPTRIEALAAETRAIGQERPLHNKQLQKQTVAPPGHCPECDAHREAVAARVKRHRAKKDSTK